MVLLDLDLPGMSGADTLRALRAMSPAPEVVVTSARGTVTAAADVARHGAFDFVPQPFDFKDLNHILRAAYEQAARRRQTQHLEAALRAHDPFPEIVGHSPGIKRVLALVNKAARTLSPVLIQGESGTGKELVARALHANSPRAAAPLTIVDCGALQDTLLESELFGHERGAFTGAHGLKHGLLEMANQGTLFLDEIGEMSPATQVKVLRALQSGEFRRIGSNRHIKADIRIIAATNKDLRQEVQRGRFREDLYYRIAVIEIHMPAAPGANGRHPVPGRPLPSGQRVWRPGAPPGHFRGHDVPDEVLLARQHQGVAERHRASLGAGRQPGAHGGRPAPGDDEGARSPPSREAWRPTGRARGRWRAGLDAGRDGAPPHPADARAASLEQEARRGNSRHRHKDALQQAAAVRCPHRLARRGGCGRPLLGGRGGES